MRLGISVTSNQGSDMRAGAQRMLERTAAAHEAGLDSLSFGDHHVTPGYVQNTPILARALAHWGDRPAGCLFLLPLWNPVLVAEQVSTLAALTTGPFILQTGIGHGAADFAGMGASLGTRGRVTDESIRVIKALLAGEAVSSEVFGITDAHIGGPAASEVQWWIGAGTADAALQRAAREGVWYAPPGMTAESASPHLATFRNHCNRFGTQARAVIRKDVLILEDNDRAEQLAGDILATGYRGMQRNQVIVGSPESAVQQLAPLADLGFEEVVIRNMTSDQAVALDVIAAAGDVRQLFS